jgi:hypothetical protein
LNNAEPTKFSVGITGCQHLPIFQLSSLMVSFLNESTPLWGMYIGDSLIREQFHTFVQEYMGSTWRQEISRINMTTYHQDRFFCCNSTTNRDTCFYGIEGYGFSNISQVVGATLHRRGAFCLSMHWRPTFDTWPSWSSNLGAAIPPSYVVFNQGLHVLKGQEWKVGTEPLGLRKALAIIESSNVGIKWLYHTTTDIQADISTLLTMERIHEYRTMMIAILKNTSRVQVVPADILSASSYVMKQPDGIHPSGTIFYNMALALDFGFLLNGWQMLC